jgi:hypothetical protein
MVSQARATVLNYYTHTRNVEIPSESKTTKIVNARSGNNRVYFSR